MALFIETAEPVSSRCLAKRFRLPYSPATIRNEMADLEELGFLLQPHTSAGRIPTDEGYRAYVASLDDIRADEPEELRLESLERESLVATKEAGELLQEAIQILSMVTELVAVAAFPSPLNSTFTRLQLTAVDPRQVLAVLVTNANHAEAHLLPVDQPVPQDRLDLYGRMVNDRFGRAPLTEFLQECLVVLQEVESSYRDSIRRAMELFSSKLETTSSREVLLTGTSSVLAQPEFQNFQKARAILDAFEKREVLVRMLTGTQATGAQITFMGVASNPEDRVLRDFSLVSSVYRVRGSVQGAIGILGPRRMDYPRIINYVNHVSDSLSRVFSDKEL